MSRASAGTASPASSTITSPGTNSSLRTVRCSPSRITLLVAAAISCKAAMAFSALLSCNTPSTALIVTTARMMITSAMDSPCIRLVTPEIRAAASKIKIMGSANWARKR